jgi:hypothetical protein
VNNEGHEHHKGMRQALQLAQLDWARRLRSHWIAILILVAHVSVATLYSVVVPIWEAYDETGHYEFTRYVATKRTLPQLGDPETEAMWEALQPPLYYVLAAASMSWIDVSDDLVAVENPYFRWGTSGVNYAIHPDPEGFPYSGTVLAVHVIRLISVAIGTGGVLLTYLAGLVIAPQRRWIAIGAMSIHAFWPQFLFVGSMVTNDVLAATLGSLVTFLLLWIVQRGARGPQLMALGISLGLAVLCKVTLLALLPIAAAVLFAVVLGKLRDEDGRKDWPWWIWLVLSGLVVIVAFLALAKYPFLGIPGIWRVRASASVAAVIPGTQGVARMLTWTSFGEALRYCARSFYALFGWGNLEVAAPLYGPHALAVALAAIGLLTMVVRRDRLIRLSALLVCAAVVAALLAAVWLAAAHSGHVWYANGRYLLAGMSAFSILVFTGWTALLPDRAERPLALIVAATMFTIGLVIPFHSILPAYARPQLLSREEVALASTPSGARFGDVAELLGYRLTLGKTAPGRRIGVTLYWRVLTKSQVNHTVLVEIVGPDGQGYGSDASYPADGNFATSLWEPGDIFEDDSYIVQISDEFPAPAGGLITVSLVDGHAPPLWAGQHEEFPLIGTPVPLQAIGVYAPSGAALCNNTVETSYEFGGRLELVGYSVSRLEQPQNSIGVTLCWNATEEMDENYVVFVHLRDSTGELVSQHDGAPRQGSYPTFLWHPGYVVADEHYVNVTPQCLADDCEIYVGVYNLENLERLQILDQNGNRMANDEIPLDHRNAN